MTLTEQIVENNKQIWDKCAETSFVRGLADGTLPMEKFKEYIIQDSIYLINYARVFGSAIYNSTTMKQIQFFYSILSFVTDTESAVRLEYLERFGLSDEEAAKSEVLPANQEYIDFLFEVAQGGDIREILMAILPCMVSYSYIFRKISAEARACNSQYFDFIEEYADDSYAQSCEQWCNIQDEYCAELTETEKERMEEIFTKGSLLEYEFWQM